MITERTRVPLVGLLVVFSVAGCETRTPQPSVITTSGDQMSPPEQSQDSAARAKDGVSAFGTQLRNSPEHSDRIDDKAVDSKKQPQNQATASPTVPPASAGESVGPREPPFSLVAGQPLPGVLQAFEYVSIKGDGYRQDLSQIKFLRNSRETVTPKRLPGSHHALATTTGFQIGMTQEQIDFEVRPGVGEKLELDAVMEETFTGFGVVQFLWREQPYEILDRNLRVVFSHPSTSDLGVRRKPLSELTPAVPAPPANFDLDREDHPIEKNESELNELKLKEAERKAAERAAAEVEAAKWRNWTTADGQYRVRAKFVSLVNQSITLQKEDGSTVDVPFNVLSREDQQFVTQRKWIRSTKKR